MFKFTFLHHQFSFISHDLHFLFNAYIVTWMHVHGINARYKCKEKKHGINARYKQGTGINEPGCAVGQNQEYIYMK